MSALLVGMLLVPIVGALLLPFFPARERSAVRSWAAIVTGLNLMIALVLWGGFSSAAGGLQAEFTLTWIRALGISFHVGVDGLSLPMVFLTALLFFVAVLASWKVDLRVREYCIAMLVLEAAVVGVFIAQDFFLFFAFWELELIPMYLLIGIWGGPRRQYAAMKFIIYTVVGSAFMLAGILFLYFGAHLHSFDFTTLQNASLSSASQVVLFLLFFVAFAVKLPVWPLHTWLPDAHVEAPTAVSVLLAGVLLKMGAYGMIRICLSYFPVAAHRLAPWLFVLAVVSVLYGAMVAMVQKDLKKLIAYSSISHMGFVLLGVAALRVVSLSGAVLQMFSHGLITALLFLLVGLVYDHTHTRQIPELGGLARKMPLIAIFWVVAGLASLGLPAMSGFVAEFLVFVGAFPVAKIATVLAMAGIVLTAGYMLYTIQRVFFGDARGPAASGSRSGDGGRTPTPQLGKISDASALELTPLIMITALVFLVGLYPTVIMPVINSGIAPVAARLGGG